MFLLFFLFLSLSLTSCFGPKTYDVSGQTMGTTYSVKFFTEKSFKQKVLKADLDKVLNEVNRQMSTYKKDSEITKFNNLKAGESFKIPFEFSFVLELARSISQKSEGLYDPTVGPLVNLWGFGPDGRVTKKPTTEKVTEALEFVGLDNIEIVSLNTILKKHDKVYLDLSSIAKGYGVDQLAEYLERQDVHNYFVEIGGEIRVKGKKSNGKFWTVAIEKPSKDPLKRTIQKVLSLKNAAIATSGNYRNFFESGGKSYSHVIDPRTGNPSESPILSASVVHSSTAMADGSATALMLMDLDSAKKFIARGRLKAYLVYKDASGDLKEFMSPDFEELYN